MKDYTWQELYVADKESIIETMVRNMQADLAAGYNPKGRCILNQIEAIAAYRAEYEAELVHLGEITEAQAERWCYYNLKRRGAI